MPEFRYPHTIDNGHGERLTFLRRTGDRLDVENVVAPGSGPPMHVHHRQREVLTVEEGRIGYQRLDGVSHFAGPGETVAFEAGDAHRFWNAGDTPLRCTGIIEPIENIEYFLGEIFAAQQRAGAPRVGLFDAAFLLTRYRSEFTILEIPGPVQRLLFPIIVALGHLLGRYRRYANAPAPIAERRHDMRGGVSHPSTQQRLSS